MKYIVDDDLVLSRPLEGPLMAHVAAFAMWGPRSGIRVGFAVPASGAGGLF
jgi:hypothetical protein